MTERVAPRAPGATDQAAPHDAPADDAGALRTLLDERDVRRAIDTLFVATDAKDWAAVRAVFTDEIDADFSTLGGGPAARMPADALVDAWRRGLHAAKASHHMTSNALVTLRGDGGEAFCHGHAWNRLATPTGSDLWEVWGSYRFPLRRTPSGWRLAGIVFTVRHARGNEWVRTHVAEP
jgi:hypothetical protein